MDVGPSEDGAFWLRFLRALVARGLSGVQLMIIGSHQGLNCRAAGPQYKCDCTELLLSAAIAIRQARRQARVAECDGAAPRRRTTAVARSLL